MELDYYLFKNKMTRKKFAEGIGIRPNHLSNIVNRKRTPSLPIAVRIHEATKQEVSFKEMIRDQDRVSE